MKALAGRTVVITRAADQSAATTELVTSFEAIPLVIPMIEIVDDPRGMAELCALDLAGIDWVVVTSPNGAQRVARLLGAAAPDPKLAAVGAATAEALPRCDLVADTQSAGGLVEVFPNGPGRVAVVQAVDAASTLVDGLVERHWEVIAVRPYRAVPTTPSTQDQLAALAADAVLFASGSAARAWVHVFGKRTPPVTIAIGKQTAAAAERAGLKISAIAADHSIYGMLVVLSRYLSDGN